MMPLSYDWTALNAKIDAMTPTGNTNVTIGLAWGFQLLSPVEPFNAPAPAPDLDKVIIILTDGDQHPEPLELDRLGDRRPHAEGLRQHQGRQHQALHRARDRRQRRRCCKGCATKPSMYYDVQQAIQLTSVFSSIAQNLANLRITQ